MQTLLTNLPGLNPTSLWLFFIVFALFCSVKYIRSPHNLPPGPRGYPIVGVLPLLRGKVYDVLTSWGREYGQIFTLQFGSRTVVVLHGIEALKECFVRNGAAFSGRPWVELRRVNKNAGIMMTDGPIWRDHRRFTLSCLRDFGMGKNKLEAKIHVEASHLKSALADLNGEPCDLSRIYACAVTNIISGLVFGLRYEYSDPFIHKQLTALNESIRRQKLIGVLSFFRFLKPFLSFLPLSRLLQKNEQLREEYAQNQIDEHKKKKLASEPEDYIDAYLEHMEKLKGKDSTFSEHQLRRCIQDLFIVGTETVTNALKWLTLFMSLHPEVQRKVQEEISRVVGDGRSPTMNDRQNMPYTQATLMEAIRRGPSSLFGAPHATTREVEVFGYTLPKDTWILSNLWVISFDTRFYENPYDFNPERFLKDGQVFQPETFVPFGLGPRSCPGESLAKMEIFVFFTSLMQRFSFTVPHNESPPSMEPQLGMNLSPEPFKICAIPRS